MVYSDFYDLVEYCNEAWEAKLSLREIATSAFEYWQSAQYMEEFGRKGLVIGMMMNLLDKDNSRESEEWLRRIQEDQHIKYRIYRASQKEGEYHEENH